MDRRNFLALAGASGLSMLFPRRSRADTQQTWDGPFWVTVHASGGWDPTLFCDPKGGDPAVRETPNRSYTPEQILTTNGIRHAPLSIAIDGIEVYSAQRFVQNVGSKFVFLNGVDTTTNNHETGTRRTWSGRPEEGAPSIAALAAAQVFATRRLPMAFVSYGGYDQTAGAVPLTRSSNVDNLWRVAHPNRIEPKKAESATYHTTDTVARIQAAQQERLAAQAAEGVVPVRRRALSTLLSVRQGDDGLSRIAENLPTTLVGLNDLPELAQIPSGRRGRLSDLEGLLRQAQIAIAAFKSGVAASASLTFGGFDTHSNHDDNGSWQMAKILRGVEWLLAAAADAGIADRLYVMLGSDFGRTPFYNAGNGKDHWAATSVLVSGPGIAGGRVVGASDEGFRPVSVDPKTLQPSASGRRIEPRDIHHALRKIGGLETSELAQRWGFAGTPMPLFQA